MPQQMVQPQQQIQLPAQPNQPRPTQRHAQPISNPNNKVIQSTHNIGVVTYPTYPTYYIVPQPLHEIFVPLLQEFPAYLQEIKLRSRKVVTKPRNIEEIIEEDTTDTLEIENIPEIAEQKILRAQEPSSSQTVQPPFPERLEMKQIVKQPEFDLVLELRNVCINIPLLQIIRDIPIYAKIFRELCTKTSGRQKKEPSKIQVGGKLASLMSTGFSTEKYVDPGNLVVTTFINGYPIRNNLIDLGATINLMTMETMSHIGSFDFLPTPTMLELADRSKVKREGVLEDIVVSLDSWEYPVNFYVLQPKTILGGNPLILETLVGHIKCLHRVQVRKHDHHPWG